MREAKPLDKLLHRSYLLTIGIKDPQLADGWTAWVNLNPNCVFVSHLATSPDMPRDKCGCMVLQRMTEGLTWSQCLTP